nr:ceramide kinase-like [Dermatophagoides farinae]
MLTIPSQQEQKSSSSNDDIGYKVKEKSVILQDNDQIMKKKKLSLSSKSSSSSIPLSITSKYNSAFEPDNLDDDHIVDDERKNEFKITKQNRLKQNSFPIVGTITAPVQLMVSKLQPKTENCFVSLYVNNKRCLVMYNREYLAFEPELTTTKTLLANNNDRVTIKLSDMMAVWICSCRIRRHKQRSHRSSIPLSCNCIENEFKLQTQSSLSSSSITTSSTMVTKNRHESMINPSKKQPPFMVRIYYTIYDLPSRNKNGGFRLELLTLSTHDDDQHRQRQSSSSSASASMTIQSISSNNNNNDDDDDDIAIHRETQLLTEIAYSIRTKLESFDRPKRLLLFINPYGGNKKGIQIFENKIKPILNISCIRSNVIITEHANQAKEILLAETTDLNDYDGIICIGGDGMFGEVLNGVLIRTQRENQINYGNIDAMLKKPALKLGIVPAGSTDAVVYATCGHKDPIHSIISIVLGRTINIDVGAVHNRDEEQLIRYTASFMGYGFFGDTIRESERIRWMGTKRYDWAGVKKFLKHRLYSGEIKICLEPNDGSPKDYNPCGINCSTCQQAGIKSRETLSADDSPACISIRGRFLAINSAIVSGRCHMSKYGMSPMAHVGNGCADLILVSKCSRFQYLRYLFSVAFHTKSPFEFDFIDSYRVREFEFNPIVEPTHKRKGYMFEKSIDCDFFDTFEECDYGYESAINDEINIDRVSKNSYKSNIQRQKQSNRKKRCILSSSVWNCDGEIVNDPAIHVKIHCQLIELYAPGFDVGRLLANGNIRQ